MSGRFVSLITAADPATRDQALDALARAASRAELLAECAALDAFRRQADNLYERVRALFFLRDPPVSSAPKADVTRWLDSLQRL